MFDWPFLPAHIRLLLLRHHLVQHGHRDRVAPADLLRRVAEQRELGEQWGDQYRLPSLCELAPLPLPGVCCVCSCCRYPDRFAGGVGVHVGCSHQCCRRHMPRVRLQQRCAQFAREIAVAEELDAISARAAFLLTSKCVGTRGLAGGSLTWRTT